MSTKALKKELLVAVVMLLVAAVALSGSTYAWFAKTTTVEASKLDIVVETASTLAIAHDSAHAQYTDFGTVATLQTTMTGTYVKPVTFTAKDAAASLAPAQTSTKKIEDGAPAQTAVEFYQLSEDNKVKNVSSSAANVAMQEAIDSGAVYVASNFVKEATTANYLLDTVHLAYFADGTKKYATVSVSADVTDTAGNDLNLVTSPISKALHIALVFTDPTEGGANVDKVCYINLDTQGRDAAAADIFNLPGISAVGDATQIDIYAWYEGEDEDCFTMNALAPQEARISLTFTAVEHDKP